MKGSLISSPLKAGICVSLALHAALAIGVMHLRSGPRLPGGVGDEVITLVPVEMLEQALTPAPAVPEPAVQQAVAVPPGLQPVPVAQPEPPKVEEQVTAVTLAPVPLPVPASETEPAAVPAAPVSGPAQPLRIAAAATPPRQTAAPKSRPGIRATPIYRVNPEPPYPATARRRGQEGLVLLTVVVDSQGRAASVNVKESSGFPVLDEAAQKAVKDWEFLPGRLGTIAVESEIEVPVRFKLNR